MPPKTAIEYNPELKKINIILSLVFVSVSFASLGNSIQEGTSLSSIKQLSVKQLDSIASVFGKTYTTQPEKIIAYTPELIEVALHKKEYDIANKFSSILGNTLIRSGDLDAAVKVYEASFKIAKLNFNRKHILSGYINLANAYGNKEGYESSAIKFNNEAITIAKQIPPDKKQLFVANCNNAELYFNIKKYDEAQKHLNTARALLNTGIYTDSKKEFGMALDYTQAGIYLGQDKYQEAINTVTSYLDEYEKLFPFNPTYISNSYGILLDANEQLGRFKEINRVRKKYEAHLQKMYVVQRAKQKEISARRLEVNTEKLDADNLIQRDNLNSQWEQSCKLHLVYLYIVSGICFLSIFAFIYFYRKSNKLLKEQNA